MLTLRADPGHPHGGYAVISLPADQVPGDTVEVAVFDNYSERYLGGDGWQGTREAFGPYDVTRDGPTAHVLIGPEIVNQIEEYANVRLELAGVTQDIGWPDDIVPAPGAARIGGILSAHARHDGAEAALAVRMDTSQDDAAPAPPGETAPQTPPDATDTHDPAHDATDPEDQDTDTDADTDADQPRRRRGGLWLWLAALVLMALGGGWWYFQERSEAAPVVSRATPEPDTAADACARASIAARGGFASQVQGLRACGADVSADTALSLLETAAGSGDALALLMFGEIYDSEAGDPVIEETIGLRLPGNPVTAADYYSRAVEAGSDAARERLGALCARLETMSDTLARGAYADHCGS